jgi:hypothetical protein
MVLTPLPLPLPHLPLLRLTSRDQGQLGRETGQVGREVGQFSREAMQTAFATWKSLGMAETSGSRSLRGAANRARNLNNGTD